METIQEEQESKDGISQDLKRKINETKNNMLKIIPEYEDRINELETYNTPEVINMIKVTLFFTDDYNYHFHQMLVDFKLDKVDEKRKKKLYKLVKDLLDFIKFYC